MIGMMIIGQENVIVMRGSKNQNLQGTLKEKPI